MQTKIGHQHFLFGIFFKQQLHKISIAHQIVSFFVFELDRSDYNKWNRISNRMIIENVKKKIIQFDRMRKL